MPAPPSPELTHYPLAASRFGDTVQYRSTSRSSRSPGVGGGHRLISAPLPIDLTRLAEPPDLPLPELFRRICEAAAECRPVDRAGVWLFVNGDKLLRCVSQFDRSTRRHCKGACLSLVDCPTILRTLAASPTVVCDSTAGEVFRAYLQPLGLTSVLCAALRREGRVVGLLFLECAAAPAEWSASEYALAAAAAELISARMQAAERALRTPPCSHVAASVSANPTRLAAELKLVLAEIESLAKIVPATAERCTRIADAAARGAAIVNRLFPAPAEFAQHETVPNAKDDDTGEYPPLPRPAGR